MRAKTFRLFAVVLALLPAAAGAVSPLLPRGSEIRVNQQPSGSHANASVAVFPDGGFVVVWSAGSEARARFFTKEGAPAGGERRLRGVGVSVDDVAADRDGSFLVAWSATTAGKSNVFVRRFGRHGAPLGARLRANAPSASGRYSGHLAIARDGRFAVAWRSSVDTDPEEGSYIDAMARLFSAQGVPLTREFLVGAGYPGIGDDNVYAFPYGLAFGADGSLFALAGEISHPSGRLNFLRRIDGEGEWLASTPLQGQFESVGRSAGSLASGPGGRVVAVWSDWGWITAGRFTPRGTLDGESFSASESRFDEQDQPEVVIGDHGRIVIVWTEEGARDGEGHGVFGRVFSPRGRPLSGDFQINVTTASDQVDPAMATAPGGPVVVAWTRATGTEGRSDVFVRLLSSEP